MLASIIVVSSRARVVNATRLDAERLRFARLARAFAPPVTCSHACARIHARARA